MFLLPLTRHSANINSQHTKRVAPSISLMEVEARQGWQDWTFESTSTDHRVPSLHIAVEVELHSWKSQRVTRDEKSRKKTDDTTRNHLVWSKFEVVYFYYTLRHTNRPNVFLWLINYWLSDTGIWILLRTDQSMCFDGVFFLLFSHLFFW